MNGLPVRILASVVVFLAAGLPSQLAESQLPTFRTQTDVVLVDVSVLDSRRRPVTGLTETDFTILDAGVRQSVVSFAEIAVPTWPPATATWQRAFGPDVVSNRRDARRAVVIVMDDYAAARDPRVMRTAKAIAGAVVDELGPTDLAAVVYVVRRKDGQEFTVDRQRLRNAIERFVPSGLVVEPSDPFSASRPTGGLQSFGANVQAGPSGACIQDCVATALKNVGEVLSAWPGARKTVVLISPATRRSRISDTFSAGDDWNAMFAALQRGNVSVYQFDPNGLRGGPQPLTNFGEFADATGGRAITNTNAPEALVRDVFLENSSYYLIGLKPNGGADGRFHRLTIQVDRPDTQVKARSGYYALPPNSPSTTRQLSAVERALSGGLPSGDLPVSVSLAPFAADGRPGATLAVLVRIDQPPDLLRDTVLEFTAVAFDDNWKQVGAVTQPVSLSVTPEGRRSSEVAIPLSLSPGRYEVRAAVRARGADRVGSVYASVVVPNFSRESLSLSGLVVTSASSSAALPEQLARVVPTGMTTARTFSRRERAGVVVQVYQSRSRPPVPVRIAARFVDSEDRVASTSDAILEASSFGPARQATYRLDIPLHSLLAGEYLLTVDASTPAASSRQALRFAVIE